MALLVISYSRDDRPQVFGLVRLLKSAYRAVEHPVYWDDDFEPGEPWFEQMKRYIDASPQLFVFWCYHSADSEQVRREFTYALEQKKRVVPVLVDDTALAPELSALHGIDLRGALYHPGLTVSETFELPRPKPVSPVAAKASGPFGWMFNPFICVGLGVLGLLGLGSAVYSTVGGYRAALAIGSAGLFLAGLLLALTARLAVRRESRNAAADVLVASEHRRSVVEQFAEFLR